MGERFAVFDVETPNGANDRMSAIGLCLVEDGEIVRELYTLVNPESRFDYFNIRLTGITPEAVRGKPTFPVLWELLRPMMEGRILVAHNAVFDMGVLAKCLSAYGISWQDRVPYACTCTMGRACYPELENHRLNTMCDHLGLTLNHHNAGSDSRACAELLLHYLRCGLSLEQYLRQYDLLARRTVSRKPLIKSRLAP